MTDPKNVTIVATISSALTLASTEVGSDATGFFLEFEEGSQQTVVIRLKGKDAQSHLDITRVRSVPTPDSGQGPWTYWQIGTDAHISPPFALGDEIRIEVDNTGGAPSTPQGGGHFRVIEEGGGFVLAADPPQDDSPVQSVVRS